MATCQPRCAPSTSSRKAWRTAPKRDSERRQTRSVSSPGNRLQFYQVRLTEAGAEPVFKGSGDITSLAEADGYIEVPIGVARLDAGRRVSVVLYES